MRWAREHEEFVPTSSPNTGLHLVKRNLESGLSKRVARKRNDLDSFSTSHITPAGKPESTWPLRKDHEQNSFILFSAYRHLYSSHIHPENYWELGTWGVWQEITHMYSTGHRQIPGLPTLLLSGSWATGLEATQSLTPAGRMAMSGLESGIQVGRRDRRAESNIWSAERHKEGQTKMFSRRQNWVGYMGRMAIGLRLRLLCTWRLTQLQWRESQPRSLWVSHWSSFGLSLPSKKWE